MTSFGDVGLDGMFYEAGATGVGGTFSGVGIADGSGTKTFLNGVFGADE